MYSFLVVYFRNYSKNEHVESFLFPDKKEPNSPPKAVNNKRFSSYSKPTQQNRKQIVALVNEIGDVLSRTEIHENQKSLQKVEAESRMSINDYPSLLHNRNTSATFSPDPRASVSALSERKPMLKQAPNIHPYQTSARPTTTGSSNVRTKIRGLASRRE